LAQAIASQPRDLEDQCSSNMAAPLALFVLGALGLPAPIEAERAVLDSMLLQVRSQASLALRVRDPRSMCNESCYAHFEGIGGCNASGTLTDFEANMSHETCDETCFMALDQQCFAEIPCDNCVTRYEAVVREAQWNCEELGGTEFKAAFQHLPFTCATDTGCWAEWKEEKDNDICSQPTPGPGESDPEEDDGPASCNATCLASFVQMGACAAFAAGNQTEIDRIFVEKPELRQCLGGCDEELAKACMPSSGKCEVCVADFDAAGGCAALMAPELNDEEVEALIPSGCDACGEQAWKHCSGKACTACREALALFHGDSDELCGAESLDEGHSLHDECHMCRDDVGAWCTSKEEEMEGCHTVREGDECLPELRWAMERGIVLHPGWYPGLSRSSSFEEFQSVLHARKPQVCQKPCALHPASCHTAVQGDECYGHSVWAKQVGIKRHEATYPEWLSADSPLVDFQAWLHQLHHGGCAAPCAAGSK